MLLTDGGSKDTAGRRHLRNCHLRHSLLDQAAGDGPAGRMLIVEPISIPLIPPEFFAMRTRRSQLPLLVTASLAPVVAMILSACVGRSEKTICPVPARTGPDSGFLRQYAETGRFRNGAPSSIKLTPDGESVLFLRSGPRDRVRNLYEQPVGGEERVLLTAAQLLGGAEEHLTEEELARRERMRLSARGLATYQLSRDGNRVLTSLSGALYVYDRDTGDTRKLDSDAGFPIDPQFSPDGERIATVRNGEVYVSDLSAGQEWRVTKGAGGSITNGLSEFVAQEEMDRLHGFWWSPDSARIVYQQTNTAGMEQMHIPDADHPEREPAAWPYPRPGKKNAEVQLAIIDAQGGEPTWIQWDHEAYPYLATVKWSENAPLTIVVQNRRQTEELILAVDQETGYTTTLYAERDDAWLNLDQSVPRWLEDGSGFLWTSERSGEGQLELRSAGGGLVRPITPAGLNFRNLLHVDEERGVAYVAASPDPTERHIFRVALDGSGEAEQLTHRPGAHSASFAKEAPVYIHTFNPWGAGEQERSIRSARGQELGHIASVAEKPAFEPNIERVAVGRNPQLNALVIRPRDFDSSKKYPVIVSVYGGPHVQVVTPGRSGGAMNQWIADHGFIVVSIDGRGTPGRGRDWERATKNNLIKLPLEDQARGLRALGERFPEMDISRVGIYGWSFGGYFALHAVMREPDVFHAAVAGAPVAAWEDYDTHYTERYMGLPGENPDGYHDANALTHAANLERPLLLMHGTADDNVFFVHSLKTADALFRAGKDFDFLPLSNFTHMVAEPEVTERLYSRIVDFFKAHLQ